MNTFRKLRLTAFILAAALLAAVPVFAAAKNTFVMISDGTSFGAWDMADLYQYGKTAQSPYFGEDFKKYLMTTFPLNTSNVPTGGNIPQVTYDSDQAWSTAAPTQPSSGGYTNYFKGYEYLKQNYTDSAAAATAMATGQKTYNNAINWSNDPAKTASNPGGTTIIPTLPELAHEAGKAVGTISTVQWSHATPAGFSNAHDVSRNNYVAIANQMLSGDIMDVIMGAGNPDFNNDGVALTTGSKEYRYVGGLTTWEALKAGTHPEGWKLIQTKQEFQDIADGKLPSNLRVVGTPQVGFGESAPGSGSYVGGTLQQTRSGSAPTDKPYSDPMITTVPDLATMTKAAINLLDAKSKATGDKGIFLHIEGGAVDWAAHANQTARIIEEQIDFNNAVIAVLDWIKQNGGWDENLLIITTDHGNSLPLGPDSATVFMDRIQEADIGKYENAPTVIWNSNNHTNELVPLFVAGEGSEMFAELVDANDPNFALYYPDWVAAGFGAEAASLFKSLDMFIPCVDNTAISKVAGAQMIVTPIPGSFLLMGSGLMGVILIGIRRKHA